MDLRDGGDDQWRPGWGGGSKTAIVSPIFMFGIKKCWLPEIKKSSSESFGKISDPLCSALEGVEITGVLGDQQAACLGHILREGQVKTTYGTGCFILQNVGDKPVLSKNGLLGTVCYRIGDKT